ncbi:acyl-CoA thioesterase [Candidatus Pacearchaeota archaeon]|nr:acyl-CoA thioesterase [Candidatus Pacearchaeota archaeon]|tara:strand:- start:325 stop:708 length:384 start_codon:yes stop_codon:yes gene_type:complete
MNNQWELITQHMCLVRDCGHQGMLFGGIMLQWLDEAAALFAEQKTCASKLVTRALKDMEFISPTRVGERVRLYGKIERVGKTSITVCIKAIVHNLQHNEKHLITKATFVFVALNAFGAPTTVKLVNQ